MEEKVKRKEEDDKIKIIDEVKDELDNNDYVLTKIKQRRLNQINNSSEENKIVINPFKVLSDEDEIKIMI